MTRQSSGIGGEIGAPRHPTLSCYYPLGDPLVPVDLLDVYAGEGVDVLEIGLSSPDPFLDGPDVSASMARARRDAWRRDLDAVFERLAACRRPPKRLLMTYVDPAHPGLRTDDFWRALDSVLVVTRGGDPLAVSLDAAAQRNGLARAVFVGLPLNEARTTAAALADFYVMLQANPGLTGPRTTIDPGGAARIAALRQAGVAAPIVLGFGISNGRQAAAALDLGADGVVVGSRVLLAAKQGAGALAALLRELRTGLDG